jgi:nitrous oxidase accessory protein
MAAARASLLTLAALAAGAARAATIDVPAGDGLAAAVARASPGDTLRLAAGAHRGAVVIETPRVTLEGEPGAVIDGGGQGSTIIVRAADVAIRGVAVRGSGLSLIDKDSGLFLDRGADRAVVENDSFVDNLISVYLDGPHDVTVRANHIAGLRTLRRTERGPAISLWNTPGSRILDNDIRYGRDGVFVVASHRDTVRGNVFHDMRFAVHFMYSDNSVVEDNVSVGNNAGYVLMYSTGLRVTGNVSDRDRDHGFLFNYANQSRLTDNVVRGSEKCVFIYNTNHNRFAGNWFEQCGVGVHFTAGSEGNEITGNAFVDNQSQVMYVGTRWLDWQASGRGNYWSDNPAFDLKGDGVATTAYRPNSVMDQIVWRAPAAKLLLNSPAAAVLRWAQSAFPAIHPGGVIDSAPLMQAPRPAALARLDRRP